MSTPSVVRASLAAVAIEAQRLADMSRAANDQQSAFAFDEIAMMLLAIGRDATSPLMEVASERQRSHHRGGQIDFINRRLLLVTLVMIEMEVKGCTRYAACKKVCSLVFAKDGKTRIDSAAKELARHVPLTLAGFHNSEIGQEGIAYREMVRTSLQARMADGSPPPDELIYLTLASAYADWRANEEKHGDRTAALRDSFNTPASAAPQLDLGETGNTILSRLTAELRTLS